jgi:hypothetical protein
MRWLNWVLAVTISATMTFWIVAVFATDARLLPSVDPIDYVLFPIASAVTLFAEFRSRTKLWKAFVDSGRMAGFMSPFFFTSHPAVLYKLQATFAWFGGEVSNSSAMINPADISWWEFAWIVIAFAVAAWLLSSA